MTRLNLAAVVLVTGLMSLSAMSAIGAAPENSLPGHAVVPGFERLQTAEGDNIAAGGRVLLTELNCVSCHRVEGESAAALSAKPAPRLDQAAGRIQLDWLSKYLASPHETKAGTTMPSPLAGLPAAERERQTLALLHFLSTTGSTTNAMGDSSAVQRGEALFHQIGCVACHAPQREGAAALATSVPLGAVHEKYTLPSLMAFLKDPLAVRAGGRMPSLNLDDNQVRDLACYFLRDVQIPVNVNYEYYEGGWQSLPDFSTLTPVTKGQSSGFDVGVRKRDNDFALRFTGFIHVSKDANYQFWIGSDDGSRLLIDNKEVVNVDGVHPHTVKEARVDLKAGVHAVTVEYFEAGGEESLSVEFAGPGIVRQPLSSIATPTPEPPQPKAGKAAFVTDDALAAEGRRIFSASGCASCHQMKVDGADLASTLQAKPLSELANLNGGCLGNTPAAGVPFYQLSDPQKQSLQAAIQSVKAGNNEQTPQQQVRESFVRFNCVACHARDQIGGVEEARNEFFLTTMKEMGDEGRLPPPLDGVGDKLTDQWLKDTLEKGAKDRPYMLTTMPRFGGNNVGHLLAAFQKVDLKNEAQVAAVDLPDAKLKAIGRHLVGDQALGCIKCHTFDKYKATGIQSIDLTRMSQRLREDWFFRYMANPQVYRPGTRMPAPWPFGQATVRDVLDANADQQMHAVWRYLTDGSKAGIPAGLTQGAIVLKAETTPIIYRNFIEGVSPRGIAVGYPEGVNLCFDADQFCLALIWENQFMDAALHWNGRGVGFQGPLGDNVYSLVRGVPIAALENAEQSWPTQKPDELGYRFRGYRFDAARRPVFRYSMGTLSIDDSVIPAEGTDLTSAFERTLTLTGNGQSNLWYRAASGSSIEPADGGGFIINQHLQVTVAADGDGGQPVVRKSGNQFELLVPVNLTSGKTVIRQTYRW